MLKLEFPSEVLDEILLHSVYLDPPTFTHHLCLISSGWLVFLRVNRKWRLTALACGRAWATSFTQIPNIIGLSSIRSRGYNRHLEFSERIPAFTTPISALERPWDTIRPIVRSSPYHVRERTISNFFHDIFCDTFNLTFTDTLICTWPYDVSSCVFNLVIYPCWDTPGLVLDRLQNLELSSRWPDKQLFGTMCSNRRSYKLICPALRTAHFTGIWVPVQSQSLSRLTVDMINVFDVRPELSVLTERLLVYHANQLETLHLTQAFRVTCRRKRNPLIIFSCLRHLRMTASQQELLHFFGTFSCSRVLETLNLTLLPEGRGPILPLLSKLGFVKGTCNRFHVAVEAWKSYRTPYFGVQAWRGDERISPDDVGQPEKRGADIHLRFMPSTYGDSWEKMVGECVNYLGNGPSGIISFEIPPSLYSDGQCLRGLLVPQLFSIWFVYPYDVRNPSPDSGSEEMWDWLEYVQEWENDPHDLSN